MSAPGSTGGSSLVGDLAQILAVADAFRTRNNPFTLSSPTPSLSPLLIPQELTTQSHHSQFLVTPTLCTSPLPITPSPPSPVLQLPRPGFHSPRHLRGRKNHLNLRVIIPGAEPVYNRAERLDRMRLRFKAWTNLGNFAAWWNWKSLVDWVWDVDVDGDAERRGGRRGEARAEAEQQHSPEVMSSGWEDVAECLRQADEERWEMAKELEEGRPAEAVYEGWRRIYA